ncbi:disease resistance protein RML1A-like [Abrus precatorius]|uniref:Disease resistance protein RML1A-like n=1 Tax=Abrus precatorius TaxID=3816 RepID=A0A8B8K0F7_ABRPR|nr:disease resistance protein RML1A-like [Abrus precatorius]
MVVIMISEKRRCWPSGDVARKGIVTTSNWEMQSLRSSGINKRISVQPLNLFGVLVKKKKLVNKIFAKGVAVKETSNNAPRIKYDVFVSFRGKDIRDNFLSHLIEAFPRKQIYAFVDDKLERGDEISLSLLEAIEGSFISLIIFSEDYASSRWCLEELVKIVECREKYGQIIIPVFYNIDPTNVRHQKGSYENALAEHEKKYGLSKVQMWRHALTNSANLSGINSTTFRNDAELLEDIINHVLKRLSNQPYNSKGLIGTGKPIAHLESLLCQDSKDVRVIGIWGMGGIGKTTIAEELFNKMCFEFEGCCFLAKVREESERYSLIYLQKKLFSTLLAEEVKIESFNYIKRRISRMKVLIVLDDVNDSDQIEKLFGSLDWFGSGSRIIITTRDKQVLNKVDDIYEVGILSSSEALELFNLNAFSQNHLEMEYYELSKRVINYAKGIPLVLKVLGNLLRGKDKEVWESQLDKLKKMPSKKVHDIMKLSYDDLDRKEQKIFLDLAYYESDNSVVIGLERLKDKALITISKDNIVSMHDIVQEMGWEIVRQESSEDLGSCSRLWDPDDIYEVLKNDKGTRAIRSIKTHLSTIKKLTLSPHIFAKMSQLQFLDLHSSEYDQDCLDLLPQGFQYLSSDIRYLHWMHYPLKSLPDKFSAKNLVVLDMSYSQVEKLWDGVQNLVNLKEVKLNNCKFLKELPNFTEAANLEILDLSCCGELTSVNPSIFSLNKLQKLDLSLCFSLTKLTSDTHLTSLRYLNLEYCEKLQEFSVTSENMIELRFVGIHINALPSSFERQSKLEVLVLGASEIESLPSCIKNFTRLRYLDLRYCSMLQTLPELPPSLETLLAERCRSLKTVLFPSTAVDQLKENRRKIEFWNCLYLDKHSLLAIGLNVQINVMKFAYQHLPSPELDYAENYDDYKDKYDSYQAKYVYPGSRVPEWLEYKTTKDYILIDLSSAQLLPQLGFIFCFIVSEDSEYGEKLEFDITISDAESDGKKDSVSMYMTRSFFRIASDHVCVMYDQRCSHYLNSKAKTMTRLKIKVAARAEPNDLRHEPEVVLKGFGVSPINTSTYHSFVQQVEFIDYMNKWNRVVLIIILCISFMKLKINNLI